jgi:hypothetical protein
MGAFHWKEQDANPGPQLREEGQRRRSGARTAWPDARGSIPVQLVEGIGGPYAQKDPCRDLRKILSVGFESPLLPKVEEFCSFQKGPHLGMLPDRVEILLCQQASPILETQVASSL